MYLKLRAQLLRTCDVMFTNPTPSLTH